MDFNGQPSASNCTSPDRKRLRRVTPKSSNVSLPQNANYEDCRYLLPHQQFEKFFDDELLGHICEQSAMYAIGQNRPNPNIIVGELRAFICILVITRYNYHANFRNLWSQDEDIRNSLVSNTMRRNRFQEILQNLHFEDNSNASSKNGDANPDKMWKLRPLTDHLKAKMIDHFHAEQNLSFDESMISYFGRHGCKQFIKGKPFRFGYKVWSLCTPSGYMVNSKFTKERILVQTKILKRSLENVLLLCYPLLAFLKRCGYNATGTIRENRIPASCLLMHKKIFKSMDRGYSESIVMKSTGIRLVKWKDNNVVRLLSTTFGENPKSMAQRYSKQSKSRINVPRPCAITEYNKYMCGVDRFDQNLDQYRIAYRGKKWWSSIFTWLIDASIQNAWQLHRRNLNFDDNWPYTIADIMVPKPNRLVP
ncbi:piggyBac transposable element-derived protein 3-like isoform X2 [Bactrocera tryoni]|uniref:piggyBac transposable element-derived protein 3-like isoform X2 n=1 Tax=Bactrocera tryoni TaxID=59916 RepID=UPI001A96E016|nr:piggyBac transposable element-derived protein 3-like isoform X2 [Bactrocera tryoni]